MIPNSHESDVAVESQDRSRPTAWYALRRTLPPWSFDQNLQELIQWLPNYKVNEIILKIDTEEFNHGQPPLEWVKQYQPRLWRLKEAMKNIGIVYSLNPWITLGHIDRGRDSRQLLPGLQTMVGHDGTQCRSCACPLCEVWRANTEQVWTLYAETEPHVIWVEDDIRTFNHVPVRFGCFCGKHLAAFAQRIGRNAGREEVVEAILRPGKPHPWRREFLDMQAEIMAETAGFLAKTVHRVSPHTHLGLMSSGPRWHCIEGRQWKHFAGSLANGRPLFSRAPMGNYWEQSLRGFYSSQDSIKLTRHCLPHGMIEQAEVENIPFTRYSKSVAATFIQTAISLAYGSHGVTLNLFDHCGTPMQTDPQFGRMLRDKKPFLNGLAQVAQSPGPYRGIQLLFDEVEGHHKYLCPGGEYGDLAADGELAMQMLESHGIPTTYSDSNVIVAIGQQLRTVSNRRLEEMLGDGRGILLDASAAAIVIERGMGELIGTLSVSDPLSIDELGPVPFSAEEFFNPSFNGKKGAFLTLTLPALGDRPSASIFELTEDAQVVSCMVDPDLHRHHVCSYAFENHLGGRVFAYAFQLATAYGIAFHHPLRAIQLQAAVGWLSHGNAPILIRGNGVYPLGFRKDCADETLLGLFNLSLDPWSDIEFILADHREPNEILSLDIGGNWRTSDAIDLTREPGSVRLRYGASVAFDQPLFLKVSWKPQQGSGSAQ
jgi:hypothetical protein